VIVQGTGTDDLRRGPGHYLGTPLPGQAGNAAIAGHRTTYGAPFGNLDKVAPGDPIVVSTPEGDFQYDATRSVVVDPNDVSVIAPTPANQLTLTTCTPRYSAAQRLVVQASLVGTPVPSAPSVTGPQPRDNLAGVGGKGVWVQALLWGLAATAVAAAIWLVYRRRRRWPAFLVGIPLFLAALFEFFGAISKIVPASF
jgi:sortase A